MASITASATSRLSVRSPLSERAQSMPAGRAGTKGRVIKRLQPPRGRARGSAPCDGRCQEIRRGGGQGQVSQGRPPLRPWWQVQPTSHPQRGGGVRFPSYAYRQQRSGGPRSPLWRKTQVCAHGERVRQSPVKYTALDVSTNTRPACPDTHSKYDVQ